MQFKHLFKSTDRSNLKKKMWHSLKKHIGLLTTIVADYSVMYQFSHLSIRSSNSIAGSPEIKKNLK